MLKNFKNGYAVSLKSETARNEANDCVVRAVANACDVNYDQAHKYVKETFGREKGKGTQLFNTLLKTNTEMKFDNVGQLDLFREGITRKLKHLGDGPKQGGDLVNTKYKHKPVAYTVKAFAQKFNKGNYIIGVNKHALAIKDGVVIDNGNYQYDGYRRPVEHAYQVS